jgi:acid phosphatase
MVLLLVCLGITACSGVDAPQVAVPQAAAPSAAPSPQERLLYANLYMQTAAEYEAVCLQTYNWASENLRAKVAALQKEGNPPAVVMDLDETVMDNGGYQSFLYREKPAASAALWDVWEVEFPHEVGLVPGAKAFIEEAGRLGVSVVYITNRQDRNKERTIASLVHLGLPVEGIEDRLMLLTDTGDKTPRRTQAAALFRVVMYVGDNLRDFSDEFAAPSSYASDADRLKALADRKEKVRAQADRWGDDWIVLPNPVYGEWMKPLGPEPERLLRPTEMKRRS